MTDLSRNIVRSHGIGGLMGLRGSYSTSFPATENPISEGNGWLNGAVDGGIWGNVRTTPGFAFGTVISGAPPYNDPIAILKGPWGRVQTVEATVVVSATPTASQEVELHALMGLNDSGKFVGYEILYSVDPNNPYVDIERWDGGTNLSDYHSLVPGGFVLAPQALVTGNRIKATVDANGLISAYADYGSGYVFIVSGTDTTYRSGAPGFGFFGTTTIADFGLSSFSCVAA